MQVRPFRWYGVSELQRIRGELAQRILQWAELWGAERHAFSRDFEERIEISQGEDIATRKDQLDPIFMPLQRKSEFVKAAAAGCQVIAGESLCKYLLSSMLKFPLSSGTIEHPLSQEFITAALMDLCTNFVGVQGDVKQVDIDDITRRASGWLWMQIPWGEYDLQMLVAPEVAASWLSSNKIRPPIRKMVNFKDACQSLETKLCVELSTLTLSIGDLSGLTLGDIVVLSHSLSDPIEVKSCSGVRICNADLGKRGDHKAVQLRAIR